MYAMEFGFFPFVGLLAGGMLFGLYWWVLRLKCPSRWAQAFIAVAMMFIAAVQLVVPVREVERPDAAAPLPSMGGAVAEATGLAAEALPFTEDGQQRPALGGEASPVEPALPAATSVLPAEAEASGLSAFPQLFQNTASLLGWFYLLGVLLVLVYFGCQLAWLFSLCRRFDAEQKEGFNIYHTDRLSPFSFGRNIFLLRTMDEKSCRYVLMHERAHILHRHFLKLCLLQVLVALCWYNPFVWLLFGEMRLQQEMEVDGDVLRQGVDREDYQLSLLRVCVGEGKWILMRTAFGRKPLKQRIIFMNTKMNRKDMRRREVAAVAALVLVVATTLAAGCQTREKNSVVTDMQEARHHPMRGCWTMDWISNTGSGQEVHPMAMHYGFYNDSTFLCFSYWSKKGMNMTFSISGEGYTWRGDTLVDAGGRPTDYTFPDERTAISRWMRDSTQMAGVSGPDITEQWSRIKPNEDIVAAFRAAYTAQPNAERSMDGTWGKEEKNHEGKNPQYLLVNDTVMMAVRLNPSTVVDGFRYGGSGIISTLRPLDNGRLKMGIESLELEVTYPDADHMTMTSHEGGELMFEEHYRRTEMPAYLQRAFAPALLESED